MNYYVFIFRLVLAITAWLVIMALHRTRHARTFTEKADRIEVWAAILVIAGRIASWVPLGFMHLPWYVRIVALAIAWVAVDALVERWRKARIWKIASPAARFLHLLKNETKKGA